MADQSKRRGDAEKDETPRPNHPENVVSTTGETFPAIRHIDETEHVTVEVPGDVAARLDPKNKNERTTNER